MGPAQGSSAGMDLGRGCLITLRSNNLSLIIMVIKVVPAEIRKSSNIYTETIETELTKTMTRCFNRHMINALVSQPC